MHDLSQSSDARSFPVTRFCGRTGSKVLGLVKSRAGDENTEPRAVAREITICRWEPHPADRLSKGGSERFLHYVPLCIFLKLTDIRSHLCSSLGLPCRERAGLPQLGLAARCHFGSSGPARSSRRARRQWAACHAACLPAAVRARCAASPLALAAGWAMASWPRWCTTRV